MEKGQILLIREFAALMDDKRNVCTEDKTGKKHLRAYREFTYIYLKKIQIGSQNFFKINHIQIRYNYVFSKGY